jgi:ATP-binding cassette subfamily B protein
VVDIYAKVQRVAASARRLMEITEARTILHDGERPLRVDVPAAIELRDVGFSYHTDRPVLEEMSLRVNRGERVALAGTSGNGKSTIAKLIARMYDARAGTVLVDGTDIRDFTLKSLRSAVIFVPQDPVLFDVTLRENLLYGNPHASADEIERVTKLAQLDLLIKRLPKGLEELLGPRGNRLSGGERQRVALARALLQHPKVLILDECTSALDELTEKRLLNALDHHLRDVTTIIISHRPYPTNWANRVVHVNSSHEEGGFA